MYDLSANLILAGWESRSHPSGDGEQYIVRFTNGYGASVVRALGVTYGAEEGLWELAVVTFTGNDLWQFSLTYETPITNDVLGYLTPEEVKGYLRQVAALPPVGQPFETEDTHTHYFPAPGDQP